jgi:hypothetical protein
MTRRTGLFVCLLVALLGALPAGAEPPGPGSVAPSGQRTGATAPPAHVARNGDVLIVGTIAGVLAPGRTFPISMTFRNPGPTPVTLRRVRVWIGHLTAPQADDAHPCTRLDFELHQLRGYRVRVPAHSLVDLASLGIPAASRPTLGMRNRPLNQDGCKGADVRLVFHGYPRNGGHR